jgi:hypothetical protein
MMKSIDDLGSNRLSTTGSSRMVQIFQKRYAALLESVQIARFIVGCVVLQTAKQDADPFESQCADCRMTSLAAGATQLVIGTGPRGIAHI